MVLFDLEQHILTFSNKIRLNFHVYNLGGVGGKELGQLSNEAPLPHHGEHIVLSTIVVQ